MNLAICRGDLATIKHLFKANVGSKLGDDDGNSILLRAAFWGKHACVMDRGLQCAS
jgi:hypothetical protein